MKLTDINLNDSTEVAAAHAMLAAILGEAVKFPPVPEEWAAPAPSATPFADGATTQASALPLPGLISDAPPAAAPLPQPFVSPAGAAIALPSSPTVELDSRGLPWDARIHASTKSKTKAGVWTALRGLNDDAKVARIEAELRQSAALPGVVQPTLDPAAVFAASVTPLPGNTDAPQTTLPVQLPVTNGPASSDEHALQGAMSLPGSVPADPTTFEQLMPRVTAAVIGGILPPTALQQACAALGLANVVALQGNPTLVPVTWAHLKLTHPAIQ